MSVWPMSSSVFYRKLELQSFAFGGWPPGVLCLTLTRTGGASGRWRITHRNRSFPVLLLADRCLLMGGVLIVDLGLAAGRPRRVVIPRCRQSERGWRQLRVLLAAASVDNA